MRHASHLLAITTTLALTGALTACGDDGSDDAADQHGGDFSVTEMLGELPAPEDADFFTVSVGDVTAVREANGLELPDLEDRDALGDFLLAMTAGDPDATAALIPPQGEQSVASDERHDLVGFTWWEAERFASVSAPPDDFAWYRFSDDAPTAETLTDLGDGVLTTGDSDDFVADPDQAGSVDPLGRSVRIGIDGQEAVVGLRTSDVEEWLGEDGETLADNETLATVAAVLDEEEIVSATISTGLRGGADEPTRADTIAIGYTVDDGERGFVLVYALGSDDVAADAVTEAERQFAESVVADQLDVSSIEADGSLLVVSGSQTNGVIAPYTMLQRFDLPLAF